MRRPAGYVYRPWSQERREAHSVAALLRHYGSMENVQAERTRKLRELVAERDRLIKELKRVRSNICNLVRTMEASEPEYSE